MRGSLTQQQKQMAFHLRAEGMSLVEIAKQIGCSAPMVGLVVRVGWFTEGIPDDWTPRSGRLSVVERELSTVMREVAVNGGANPSIGRCSLTIALTIKLVAPRFSNYGRAGSVMRYHVGCIF